jgi:hypothetical protein
MTRKRSIAQGVDSALYFIHNAVGGIQAVLSDELPNVVEVGKCVRMKE